jgi:methionine sulfoxide reductase heme-binding subunit
MIGRASTRKPASTPDAWLKPGLFIGALTPLASIALRALTGSLNANPIAEVENELGLAALIFLIASLACTPARRVFGLTWPPRIRRELGLLAFFYAMLHVGIYVFLDQAFDLRAMVEDVLERPFITVGFGAAVLLVPLAITSTKSSIRRLGFARWQRLHQLAYVAAVLAALHFIWRVKIDVSQPLTYAAAVCLLLLVRVLFWVASRRAPAARAGRSKRRIVPA